MAVNDIAVLRIVGRYQSQNIVNSMHYLVEAQSTGDEQLWDDLVNAWFTAFNTSWPARHIEEYNWVGLKAFTVRGDTRPPGERSVSLAGTLTGNPQVAFVCRTITFYTDSANARRRGRLMLSGGGEDLFEDSIGSVTTGEVIALTTLGTALMATLSENSNDFKPILYDKATDTVSNLILAKGRSTPSAITSRRIRRFLIG